MRPYEDNPDGSDVANELLRHTKEDLVMRATLRFARGDSGATVVARTAAARDDLPTVGRGHVVESYAATTTAVAAAVRRLGSAFTVTDVVETAGVDVTRERVRQVLAELADRGVVAKHKTGVGLADTYDRSGGLNGAGDVELPAAPGTRGPGDAEAPPNSSLVEYYTRNLGVVAPDGLLEPGEAGPGTARVRIPPPDEHNYSAVVDGPPPG
jgi:hypothetical protein